MSEILDRARAFLTGRRRAYQQTFLNPVGEQVLEDLARFCRAHESTFHQDPRIEARLDGRKEVWLRVAHHLNLSEEQLWKLYGEKKPGG